MRPGAHKTHRTARRAGGVGERGPAGATAAPRRAGRPREAWGSPLGWWYVARALGQRATTTRLARETPRRMLALGACAAALALAACGGDEQRQDAGEPEGDFPVEVVSARFPAAQRLAQTRDLRLELRNAGERAIPALTITIQTNDGSAEGPFEVIAEQENLADPNRPVWILEEGYPKCASDAPALNPPCLRSRRFTSAELDAAQPAGAQTAAPDTFSFGSLEPGESLTAIWRVTPVQPGRYTVRYEVAAGLQGKASAVTPEGEPVEGEFEARISKRPPRARVTGSGRVVIGQ